MSGGADPSPRGPGPRAEARPSLAAALRVADWWQFKLTPPLALYLATSVAAGAPLLPRWLDMAALIAAVAVCAAYVSLINDYFDRDEDARSGKPNRVAALPPGALPALLLLLLAAGSAVAWTWRGEPAAILLYAASWAAFTAYSAPPLRLKTRGLPGVLADAAGSTIFPALLAVTLALGSDPAGLDPWWLAAAAAWAAGWGVRGILWHQTIDSDKDRKGAVRTFVQRRGPAAAGLVGRYIAFPLELAGLALLLVGAGSPVPVLLLLIYLAVVVGRSKLWRAPPGRLLLLDEYYDGLLAPAMIASSAVRHPADWLLLIPCLLLFGRRPARVLHHAARMIWDEGRRRAYLLASAARRRIRPG